ncbi:MAG: Txe/YoeB family addiction module toxin [Fretibacterium sp.]|nr:Txe/YoeB family addiction module toxin [Fretibacterium sp.]
MHEDTVFSPTAFEDFLYWAQNDRKTLAKIKALISDIHRNGLMEGLGKPEKLLGQPGEYSRRITSEHRLVYRLDGERLKILSCRGHYQD